MASRKKSAAKTPALLPQYDNTLGEITELLESARRTSVRSVNAIMTLTYWEIGRRIVESEQAGKGRAKYGKELLARLSDDLTDRFGRGFSRKNLQNMRAFYREWPIRQTVSGNSDDDEKRQTPSGVSVAPGTLSLTTKLEHASTLFPLPWSHYVKLLSIT